jgi:hypothetical protein
MQKNAGENFGKSAQIGIPQFVHYFIILLLTTFKKFVIIFIESKK